MKCQVTLTTPAMMDASGGAGALAVTTQPECAWDASTNVNWISALSPASGQGTANVSFRVAANDGTATRDGMIVVNGVQARVSQRAACRYEVGPASQTLSSSGGGGSINVATTSDCSWSAVSEASWIALSSSASGSGNGTVSFTVGANPGEARSGAIAIANQRPNITQAGVTAPTTTCDISISPTSQNIPAGGGTASVAVSVAGTCQWTATSNASWITVTSGATGTASGAVTFSVASNTGAARTGTLTIGGRALTVSQAGSGSPTPPPPTPPPPTPPAPNPPASCSYAVNPRNDSAPAPGGSGTVDVSTTSACAWTASSNASWITITSGGNGTGDGRVGYLVQSNVGASRTGTLTVAGQTVTVTQAAVACSYSISPDRESVDASAATRTISVSTSNACSWTASSNVPWIAIASGASGTGSGSVSLNIAANPGVARSGTATIAGQSLTVNQAASVASCTYSISPTTRNVAAGADTGTVSVTSASGCTWTASSNTSWLTITSGQSGTGNGTVGYAVQANAGGARTGTLTIAGQTFTVSQAAAVCSYAISPNDQRVGPNAGSGTISVSTTSNCTWTASSNDSWITVTAGASGTGNGTVTFSYTGNNGTSRRTGTLTVAGTTATVEQNARGNGNLND